MAQVDRNTAIFQEQFPTSAASREWVTRRDQGFEYGSVGFLYLIDKSAGRLRMKLSHNGGVLFLLEVVHCVARVTRRFADF